MTKIREPKEVFPPGEFIREELEARGWTQSDLAKILGRPLQAINEIVNGKEAHYRRNRQGIVAGVWNFRGTVAQPGKRESVFDFKTA
jgi:hypothetical protein